MKNSFKFLLASLILIAGVGISVKASVSNDFSDFWTIKGIGALANTAIAYIDTSRDFNLYDGDIILGTKGNQPSTTAGEYPGFKVQIKNCGTVAWVQGTVVVANANAAGCGQASNTTGSTAILGIAEGAVAVNAVGSMTVNGWALALTTGTVNRGDVLISTGPNNGYLAANNSPSAATNMGVAVSSGNAAGGLTIIRVR